MTEDRETMLHKAAGYCPAEAVARLLIEDCHLNVNAQCRMGRTPLFCATHYAWKAYSTIEMLLEKGADPNIGDEDGQTPLLNIL